MTNTKANLFLIGAPKCGTTSLHYYLNQHPDVRMSTLKEPHYFCDDYNRRVTNINTYNKQFDFFKEEKQYFGESSANYLYNYNAISKILDYNPDSKFIIMIRNPTEMAVALYYEMKWNGTESEDFITAWNFQEERRSGAKLPPVALHYKQLMYKDRCSLGSQIEAAKKLIPKNNLLIATIEELKENVSGLMQRIENFLNLAGYNSYDFTIKNERKSTKFQMVNNFVSQLAQIKQKLGIDGSFGFGRKILRLNTIKLDLDKEQLNKYHQYIAGDFKQEIQLLGAVLNRDVSEWQNKFLSNSNSKSN